MPDSLVVLHIAAGSIALAAGGVALYSVKGSRLHRKSGMLFVLVMLLMSVTGAAMAALKPEVISVIAGALTFYLVMTALLTVRRPASGARWIDAGAMLAALTIGIAGIHFGLEALGSATGTKDGFPAPPYFIFGSVALLASLLDLRMLLARGVKGAHRLARHLWRMCFALLIAAASFFLGQSQVFPGSIPFVVLTIPVFVVLFLMLYWLGRVLFSRRHQRA